jgi:hypothetical protein
MEHPDDVNGKCGPLVERLRTERTTPTRLELDAVKQRVLARAAAPRRTGATREFIGSRLAILAMLVLGFTFSTAGAGLAISGFTSDGQASVAQYPAADSSGGTVVPRSDTGGARAETAPEDLAERAIEAHGVQESRQVEMTNSAGGLPFTGLAGIPILLLGIGLISTVLILRRKPSQRG